MRCSDSSLRWWCPSPSRGRRSGPLDAESRPTASRATWVATAAATTLGCCATLRSDGSCACAWGTVTRLPSVNADIGDALDFAGAMREAALLPALREPVSVEVRRVGAAGAVTRAVFAGVAGAGVAGAGVAGAGVVRGDRAGADAADDVPAGDVPAGDVPAGDVPAGDVPAGKGVGVGRAGAGGPPALDSTRRAWCSR